MKFRPIVGTAAAGLSACLCLLLAASCARRPEPPAIERIAVLRFENLGADFDTDWMGRAFAEILTAELAGAPGTYVIPSSRLHGLGQALGPRPVSAPGISAEAPLALAAGANRLVYGQYYVDRGVIHASVTLEDPRARRMVRVLHPATASDPDVVAAATALARQIWPQARPYAVHNAAAVEAYANAVEARDPGSMEALARKAIADDPDYGSAYLLLAELKAQRRDRGGMGEVLQWASSRGAALPPADRARVEVMAAGLAGNPAARERALTQLARLIPDDPTAWSGLGEISAARHHFVQAVQAYGRALAIEPEDATSWNQLAYSAASAGNLPAAMAALRRYQALRPTDPNGLDSMGDVNLISGRLKEAEQFYLDAAKMSPAFLNGADFYKAAVARLMSGDIAGADALYGKYPGAARHRAEWLWISGRRKEACSALTAQVRDVPPDAQSNAYAELAIWSLVLGDRPAASRAAEKAAANALGTLARFLVLPPAGAAEWMARAEQYFPGQPAAETASRPGELAVAYALLLSNQFQPAAEALHRLYDNSPAAPEASTPVELAWALIETGNYKDAAELIRFNPAPAAAGPSPLLGFSFPRLFRLRAQLAEKEGKAEEARANQRIFETLSGR